MNENTSDDVAFEKMAIHCVELEDEQKNLFMMIKRWSNQIVFPILRKKLPHLRDGGLVAHGGILTQAGQNYLMLLMELFANSSTEAKSTKGS